jgi:hypothetical protein
MTVDEDEAFDQEVFERRFWPKRVYRDGHGPYVRLTLTDSASRRSAPLMDAVRQHQLVLDGYARLVEPRQHRPHQASLSDSAIRNARSQSEAAREQWLARVRDAWKQPFGDGLGFGGIDPNGDQDDDANGDDDDDRTEAERARDQWIDETSRAWQRGVYAGPGPTRRGAQYGGPSSYAQSVWSAQNAIRPGSPYAAEQVEAARRKTTRESPTDGGDDRARAYAEYCTRISTHWKR